MKISSKIVLPLRSNIHNKIFVLYNFEDTITKSLGYNNTTIIEKANNNNLARGLKVHELVQSISNGQVL
jgi:hypothetical protein